MPFSKGFGRRLRYVVYDDYHESVIGIIGLQSPPADLACRDKLFNFPREKKMQLVNQTMDIFCLGALPPYSALLGGKLVAGLAASTQIVQDYSVKYANTKTLLTKSILDNRLRCLTTTSAFGRSSIYNRLKFRNRLLAEPIGYTLGTGNVHLEEIYSELVQVLKENNTYHGGGYGRGPKSRWQNLTRAFTALEIPHEYRNHGVKREVFLFRLDSKLEEGMSGERFGDDISIDGQEYCNFWKERWALPRASTYPWQETSTVDYMLQCLT